MFPWTREIDLGVVFDSYLSFKHHVSMSTNKANKLLRITRRLFCSQNFTSFTLLWKTIVRRYLKYAATICNPCKKDHIFHLERIQHRATKLLHIISHFSYPDWLAALELPTLAFSGMSGDMMETFMIVNIFHDSRATTFISMGNFSTTMEHSLKQSVQHANFIIKKLTLTEQEKRNSS